MTRPRESLARTLRTAGTIKKSFIVQINRNMANPDPRVPKRLRQRNHLDVQRKYSLLPFAWLLVGCDGTGAISKTDLIELENFTILNQYVTEKPEIYIE